MASGGASQHGTSLLKDASVLDYDWVPDKLWHRDEHLGALDRFFRGSIDGSQSQRVLITGPVGTGKTALAKVFGQRLRDEARSNGKAVETVWVNCRKNAAEGLVLHKLLQHFDKNYPERGFALPEMLRDLQKHVDRRDVHLLVLLDEADALLRKETDLVYGLSRFDDDRPVRKATLSLLLVSAREDLYDLLDEATRSTIKRTNRVTLQRYNADQLRDIVQHRAELAFHKGIVDDQVVELIADIAGEDGDARYAIELLEGAGRNAETDGSDTVEGEHVRAAKAHTRSVVSEAKLGLLAPHVLFVLLGVARKMRRRRKEPFVKTGEAEEAYALVAEEYGERARGHTQFWKYLKELEGADWVHLKASAAGKVGRTQLISIHDLPAKILEEKIQAVLKAPAKA